MPDPTHAADLEQSAAIERAAAWIADADAILITAGAGMGVDSGLPDFRGDAGFWQAYPALAAGKVRFVDIANAEAFRQTPALAWGFYGHRLDLYRATLPHAGFHIAREIASAMPQGGFVFTSNVDGQFQRAGFDLRHIVECHGSIHHLQCSVPCSEAIWSAQQLQVDVDAGQCLWRAALPLCPHCGALARPNILMFNDDGWLGARTDRQADALAAWLAHVRRPVVLEMGAGTAIPSVRRRGEAVAGRLIRINPAAPGVSGPGRVALPLGALAGLRLLRAALRRNGTLAA